MDVSLQSRSAPPQGSQTGQGSCMGGIFVLYQMSGETVSPQEALKMGTAFLCLYDPYWKGEQ